jgi:AraC family transcriptional regulator
MRQNRHFHDRTSVTLVFGGSIEETVGSVQERAAALSVVFKPAGTEHTNRIGSAGAMTVQAVLDEDVLPASPSAAGPAEWGWAHGGSPARRFLAMCDRRRVERDVANLEGDLYDVLAELMAAGSVSRDPPSWLLRIAEELDDTFRRPRRVRDIARDAAIHPVALARAHRRHFGCSISERLRARRVREAAGLLGRPETELTRVAYLAGFSDQSHPTRVFRSETGVTPGRYRRWVTG